MTFRPKNSSYMYIYVLIVALSFREDTRMACYCLKGENNLDMPGKNMSWNSGCNIAYDAVIGIVVEFQIFSISNHWHWYFWGTMRETRLGIYSISRYYLVFYVPCKPRGGLEVSESGPTSLLKDSRLAQPPGSQICCNT